MVALLVALVCCLPTCTGHLRALVTYMHIPREKHLVCKHRRRVLPCRRGLCAYTLGKTTTRLCQVCCGWQ